MWSHHIGDTIIMKYHFPSSQKKLCTSQEENQEWWTILSQQSHLCTECCNRCSEKPPCCQINPAFWTDDGNSFQNEFIIEQNMWQKPFPRFCESHHCEVVPIIEIPFCRVLCWYCSICQQTNRYLVSVCRGSYDGYFKHKRNNQICGILSTKEIIKCGIPKGVKK